MQGCCIHCFVKDESYDTKLNGLGSATVSREPRKLPKLNGGAYALHYVSKSFARNGLVIMLDNGTATKIVNVLEVLLGSNVTLSI